MFYVTATFFPNKLRFKGTICRIFTQNKCIITYRIEISLFHTHGPLEQCECEHNLKPAAICLYFTSLRLEEMPF